MKALIAFRAGSGLGPAGLDGIAKRFKARQIKWCLAEALRRMGRSFLRSCSTVKHRTKHKQNTKTESRLSTTLKTQNKTQSKTKTENVLRHSTTQTKTNQKTRSCTTISLHQDVRKGRLLVRYKAANDKLQVKSGALGSVQLTDKLSLCADGLKAGTLRIVQEYCMARASPPLKSQRHIVDTKLANMLRSKVEV